MPSIAVLNGVPWFDDHGNTVNAHGACILEHEGTYYLFGEYKTDSENTFIGFSCYSSTDLTQWHFERLVLPQQADGLLGPNRIGERVKVMRSPETGKFVLYAHSDDLTYTDPHTVVAVSDSPAGTYSFLGPLTHQGEPIYRWDLGTFQDDDGTGYLLLHEGDFYRLSPDYLTAAELVCSEIAPGGESPAMMKADGTYYAMFSNKTSWDRNDNYYLKAPAPSGPWTHMGELALAGTCTWNSQCSFVFQAGGVPIYMGDRWSFPHQASAGTQVWLPITVRNGALSLPEYWEAWNPVTSGEVTLAGTDLPLALDSNGADETASAPFTVHQAGAQVTVNGAMAKDGGYARVEIIRNGTTTLTALIDLYAPVAAHGTVFVSPPLAPDDYVISVTVAGEGSVFYKKNGTRMGSTGTRVVIERAQLLA